MNEIQGAYDSSVSAYKWISWKVDGLFFFFWVVVVLILILRGLVACWELKDQLGWSAFALNCDNFL